MPGSGVKGSDNMVCSARLTTARDAIVEFSAAMLKSLCGKPWGIASRFECPLCGGNARAFSSSGDGRKIAKCSACNFQVVERHGKE